MLNITDDRLIRLIQNDATAYRLYRIASTNGWENEQFMLELCLAFAREKSLQDDELRRIHQHFTLPAEVVKGDDSNSFSSAKADADLFFRQYVRPPHSPFVP